MANALGSASKTAVDVLNKLSGWLLLLAIIWLCWGIARVVWLVLAPPQAPNLPVLQLQNRQRPTVNTNTALALFETPEPTIKQQASQPPPQTKLAGVMLAQPNSLSSALIEVDGVVENYRIGEMLKGSTYKLIDVSWNQAIIADSSDNQVVIDMAERMNLDQGSLSANTPSGKIDNRRLPSANPLATLNAGNNPVETVLMPNGQDNSGRNLEEERQPKGDPSGAIETAMEELKQNPASYLSRMGVMATGEGYQVTDAMPSKLRKNLGLETGDRVLSVNGQNVGNDPASDADLLGQVKQSGAAVIEVKRGDQVITVRQQF